MRVLITGGRGMVARNVALHPEAELHDVLAPGRDELDLADFDAVRAMFSETSPDAVVHAAGRVGGILANNTDPAGFLVANLDIGRNVVLAAREAGIKKLINLGSSCMYPREAGNPLREEMLLSGPLEPTNEGYALAKLVVAKLCEYVSRVEGLDYKTLIPCNLYGYFDKYEPSVSHMLPAIIRKVHLARVKASPTVDIWGDGTALREYLFCGDLADGIWHCLGNFDRVPTYMNIGTGTDRTVNEYYEAVAKVIGWTGTFVHDLDRPVGMRRKVVSTKRQAVLGWSPKTSLEDGIRLTYEHYLRFAA